MTNPVNPGLTPAISKKAQAKAAGCTIYRYDKDVESRCYSMLQYPDGEYSHIERKTDAEAWEDFDPAMVPEVAPPTDLEALWDAFRLGQVKDPRPDKLVFIEIVSRAISQATKAPPELKGARECWICMDHEGNFRYLSFVGPGESFDGQQWHHMREVQPTESPTDQTDYKALYEEMLSNYVELAKIRKAEQEAKPGSEATPVSLVSPAPGLTWTKEKPTEGDNHYHFRERGGKGRTIVFLSGDGDEVVTFYNGRREFLGNIHGEFAGPIPEPQAQPIPPEAGASKSKRTHFNADDEDGF